MRTIPFYSNTKDNTHCFQTCLKSILKFYFPKKEYSFSYLDRVTAHKKNKWTWVSAALLFLANLGFKIINIENFNYKKFALSGEKYLQKFWTNEIYQTQKKFSDIKNEQKLAKKLIKEKKVKLIKRPATIKDIKYFYKKGYTILCSINPYILERLRGYSSHIVIITGIKENSITFHDPGLPPRKNRKSSIKMFLRALCYPTKLDVNMIAVKLLL